MTTQVDRFLEALRETHPDFAFMFMHGGCYQLHVILRTVWPQGELWYQSNPGHVWTRIDGVFYDIRGGRTRRPAGAVRTTVKALGRPDRWKRRLALIIDASAAANLRLEDIRRNAGGRSRTDAEVAGKAGR